MNSMPMTIMDLFSSGENALSQDKFLRMESCEKMCQLRGRISRKVIGMPWALALSTISKKALEILDLRIPEILVTAWNKYQILDEYADEVKKDVVLASHTVKSLHRPRLEVIVNEVRIHDIEFEIEVSFILHGIVLRVQNGKVKEISAGNCRVRLSVRCEECSILENETRTFEFFRPMSLGDGILIKPSAGK
jgi:hypothetical protein